MKYRYRTRAVSHGHWSDWVETNGPEIEINMAYVSDVQTEAVVETCTEIAPVTFDGKGFTCDSIDTDVCKAVKFHGFTLDDRKIRWDA